MKVQNYQTSLINGRKRVSADIIWETANRPREEIYFEVDDKFADDLSNNPNAFFLATVFPALYYGEERYTIDGQICPVLYQGVLEALAWIGHWYYDADAISQLNLEIETSSQTKKKKQFGNAACFLSGGIDSYATLFDNRSIFPSTHPGYIKDVIVAFGLEQSDPEKFDYVLNMLKKATSKLEATLIPVYTNIYLIYREEDALNEFHFWIYEFQGAALSSIAHILRNRLHNISIAATFDLANLGPYGSHPLLDPNFSSSDLRIRHDGLTNSRLEKTRIVSENYPHPLQLRVCNRFKKYENNKLNCGECEKCIRTMLGFLVLGKLKELDAFPHDTVTREMIIKNAVIKDDYGASCYEDLINPLTNIKRNDLARAVRYVLQRYKAEKSSIKSKLFKANEKYFNGSFSHLYKYF